MAATDTARPSSLSGAAPELLAWHHRVRAQFPQIVNSPAAYLDSSATSQKPRAVLDAVIDYLTTTNANAGRGSYPWANRTTRLIEQVREQVKHFLGDPGPQESSVHFVGGATEALRRVATDWLASALRTGDEIVVPGGDHSANAVPWHDVVRDLARRGISVIAHAMPYETSGDYDTAALAALIGPRLRFVAVTHVHHVYGVNMNVHRVRRVAGEDVVICLDAAQSVGHLPVDLAALDVDFLAFSGHKAMALPGVGVLWAGNRRTPRFELAGWAGSANTAGIVSLGAALTWLAEADPARIDRWTTGLGAVLTDGLADLPSIDVLGCQASLRRDSDVQRRQGIVTFRHRHLPAGDLGFYLESQGHLVRADHHCQAGRDRLPSVRVSTHAYTSPEEISGLLDQLRVLEEKRPWQ
ncbi:aminotransferase class V-fold PLP-dependent enzyme [Geodermatophilus sp. DSM 44513]|uniref:aminotransferase class V-fold PLP-dependent enzyme n=1 Tax=Geodermatophilus sp. DSM 44513 TaxID=1528104 RepID=UPI00128AD6A2|nr:aminotransferase class V-fold PLP-dependent enzyme [Geodermatophilus sp. DSM 44513]WNV77623.1 aminotransferase class V-fold PLP-dependent enzyme [Geodermatophilus sp. DSM 44513]